MAEPLPAKPALDAALHGTPVVTAERPSTALALRDEAVELAALREAVGDVEILCYEAWTFDKTLTKDAARRLLTIADIFGWTMPWVDEMREWV